MINKYKDKESIEIYDIYYDIIFKKVFVYCFGRNGRNLKF